MEGLLRATRDQYRVPEEVKVSHILSRDAVARSGWQG
jgi:hypothetical protein